MFMYMGMAGAPMSCKELCLAGWAQPASQTQMENALCMEKIAGKTIPGKG